MYLNLSQYESIMGKIILQHIPKRISEMGKVFKYFRTAGKTY